MSVCSFCSSAGASYLKARGGEMLGASFSQISFNLGNAIGAFVGALPVKYGLGYQYTAIPGAFFAFIGL